ncbi:MAG: von Willebrand factor type A domain-containing protein, partial [Candidatus Delongbacteria bacterium]|nr:von Willebrand factor type A domain-containing protein [Candidatus Delongbacteria bacterium]
MKKIAVLLFIFTLALTANSNVQIKGIVKDYLKYPVKGAELTLVEQKQKVQSDDFGNFFFSNVKTGTYSLKCTKEGFNSVLVENIVVLKDSTVNVEIRLTNGKPEVVETKKYSDLVLELKKERVLSKEKKQAVTPVGIEECELAETMDFDMSSAMFAPATGAPPAPPGIYSGGIDGEAPINHNTEEYSTISENNFKKVKDTPVSTFSIDVDAASYANMRRFINQNQMPYKDAIRIEEMINYFDYDYKYPEGDVPFAINTEISECPWNKANRLVHIGLQGRKMEQGSDVKSNFVFLLDVSGSMDDPNKLPLLKKSFSMLIEALKPTDRIAIVVYASASGIVLPSTEVNEKKTILDALEKLQAGGSTAGGAGIKLAYDIAEKYLIKDGNNRIILATDGDFNVGVSSTSELVKMMEEKRNKGIFLTILGFGIGNYKDGRMEEIADKGNGNYFYIDNILEAKKVLVTELAGTIYTIAKDVKIQIEFNPVKVESYRLIGYENRILNKEDFDDDKKDAGELGAGHTVTALYEIVPGTGQAAEKADDMKYQQLDTKPYAYKTNELMFVKLRYKEPKEDQSKLIEHPLKDEGIILEKSSNNFRFSAA